MALFCAALELLLGGALATLHGSVALIGAGAPAAAGMVGALLRDRRRNPVLMVLAAVHRGIPVVLFTSTDKTEFQQVRRAVVRAVELHRDHCQ